MKDLSYYVGREQTYLKHFFLENYLERVAYNIFSFMDEFVYVDGFSGPWRSQDGHYEDTSFVIAIRALERIRQSVHETQGKNVRVRYIFIESDTAAFKELESSRAKFPDLNISTWHDDFQTLIPRIIQEVGKAFSLVFIDPTGWTGFPLNDLKPLFSLRGEFIINFMFDHISRFLEDSRPEISETFDPVFGTKDWRSDFSSRVAGGSSREDAILATYVDRVRTLGKVPYVTSTRIKKPLVDRSYFHLVYGTKNWKGIYEFREVERRAADEQEQVRDAAKYQIRLTRTGQDTLWKTLQPPGAPKSFEEEKKQNIARATQVITSLLKSQKQVPYELALSRTMEVPLIWKADLRTILADLRTNRLARIVDRDGADVAPKPGKQHKIIWLG